MSPEIKAWLIAAGVRAIKTMAQTAVSIISVGTVMQDVDWMMVGSAALLSGVLSILTSIAGLPEVAGGTSLGEMVSKPDETE
jgi:biotin transporter BioY